MVNSRFLKGIRLFKNPWAKKGSHRAMLPLAPVMRVVNSKGPSRSMNPKTSAQSGEHPVSLAEDLSITAFALLEGLCSFVFVVGRDGTIRYATPSVFRQTGVEPSKCVGHPFVAAPFWSEATAQEDIAVGLRDAFQGRKADFLVDISTLSKRITVNFDCKPLRSAEGIIEAILVEGHDVTDRRLLERKLRDSHFHWRTIADCAVDWEFWLHPAGYFIYNSPSCQRITGYSIDELTQNRITINSMAHPDDRKRVTELLTAAYSGTTGHSQRFRIVRRDGSARSVSMSWQPVQGDDGRFLGIRGSVRDVTDLADTEAELQRLLEAYRILAMHFPKGLVALLDSELRFVVADGPAFQWVEIDPKRIIGKRFDQVFEPALLERVGPLFFRARAGHEVSDILEYQNATWLVHLTPILGPDRGVRHVIASAVLSRGSAWDALEEKPTSPAHSIG
jgi:PAS domain S-box-containing protein